MLHLRTHTHAAIDRLHRQQPAGLSDHDVQRDFFAASLARAEHDALADLEAQTTIQLQVAHITALQIAATAFRICLAGHVLDQFLRQPHAATGRFRAEVDEVVAVVAAVLAEHFRLGVFQQGHEFKEHAFGAGEPEFVGETPEAGGEEDAKGLHVAVGWHPEGDAAVRVRRRTSGGDPTAQAMSVL